MTDMQSKTDLSSFVIRDGKLLDYTGDETEIVIPDNVRTVGKYAFEKRSALEMMDSPNTITSIVIPDGVRTIEPHAFEDLVNLRSIVVPDSVMSIGFNAFARCKSLTHIKLSGSITVIEECLFHGCDGLETIMIPEGVTAIKNDAFRYCINLKSATMPNGLKEIGKEAFAYCYRLTDITIPDSVERIGSRAFCDVANVNGDEEKFPFMFLRNRQKTTNGFVESPFVYEDSSKKRITAFIPDGDRVTIPEGVTVMSSAFDGLWFGVEISLPEGFEGVPFAYIDRSHIGAFHFNSWEGLANCYLNPGDDKDPFMKKVTVAGKSFDDTASLTVTPSIAGSETIPKIVRHYPNIKTVFSDECFAAGVKISPEYISFMDPTVPQIGSLLLNQAGKKWSVFVDSLIDEKNINAVTEQVIERLRSMKKLSSKQAERIGLFAFDNRKLIDTGSLRQLSEILKSKNKAQNILDSYLEEITQ